jgi:hypothetical protein
MGAGSRSAVESLVERFTRYVMLLPLGADKSAITVEARMREAITALPAHLDRSITWTTASPGTRARRWRAREVHPRYRYPGLLLRPALTLAAGQQPEHERVVASVPAQGR